MKFKHTFIFINIVCVLLTVGLVSYSFFKNLESGSQIYASVYEFSSSSENEKFKNQLIECSGLTEEKISHKLDSLQTEYLYELHTCVERLDDLQTFLSRGLIESKKKSASMYKINLKLIDLNEKRSNLMEDFALYKIKLSGNVSGDPEGAFKIFVLNLLDYLADYSDEISLLNNACCSELNMINQVEHDIVDVYLNSIQFLKNNFSEAHFIKSAFETICDINTRILIVYNNLNLDANIIGGIYSQEGEKFCLSYKNLDKEKFIEKYMSYSKSATSISNTTDEYMVAFYYLNKLLRV